MVSTLNSAIAFEMVWRLSLIHILKGKLKKVKYYYGGEYQINYVLYVKPKFVVEHSYMYDDAPIQSRICVYIDKDVYKRQEQ